MAWTKVSYSPISSTRSFLSVVTLLLYAFFASAYSSIAHATLLAELPGDNHNLNMALQSWRAKLGEYGVSGNLTCQSKMCGAFSLFMAEKMKVSPGTKFLGVLFEQHAQVQPVTHVLPIFQLNESEIYVANEFGFRSFPDHIERFPNARYALMPMNVTDPLVGFSDDLYSTLVQSFAYDDLLSPSETLHYLRSAALLEEADGPSKTLINKVYMAVDGFLEIRARTLFGTPPLSETDAINLRLSIARHIDRLAEGDLNLAYITAFRNNPGLRAMSQEQLPGQEVRIRTAC